MDDKTTLKEILCFSVNDPTVPIVGVENDYF